MMVEYKYVLWYRGMCALHTTTQTIECGMVLTISSTDIVAVPGMMSFGLSKPAQFRFAEEWGELIEVAGLGHFPVWRIDSVQLIESGGGEDHPPRGKWQ